MGLRFDLWLGLKLWITVSKVGDDWGWFMAGLWLGKIRLGLVCSWGLV